MCFESACLESGSICRKLIFKFQPTKELAQLCKECLWRRAIPIALDQLPCNWQWIKCLLLGSWSVLPCFTTALSLSLFWANGYGWPVLQTVGHISPLCSNKVILVKGSDFQLSQSRARTREKRGAECEVEFCFCQVFRSVEQGERERERERDPFESWRMVSLEVNSSRH